MAKELREAGAGGFSGAPLEEFRRRFHHSDFFGYGGGDPLVEGGELTFFPSFSGLPSRGTMARQLGTTPRGTKIYILS